MHEVSQASPFHFLLLPHEQSSSLAIVVTLEGHDGTYAQTVYERMLYYLEDIRVGRRFVDVDTLTSTNTVIWAP